MDVKRLVETRSPKWHRCRRYWDEDLRCPFHPQPQEAEDDDDDDEFEPIPVAFPDRLIPPPGEKAEQIADDIIEESKDLVKAIPVPTLAVQQVKVLSTPGQPGHFADADAFKQARRVADAAKNAARALTNAKAGLQAAQRAHAKARRIQKGRASRKADRKAATRQQNEQQKGVPWKGVATLMAAAAALGASLEGPSKGSGPTAGAEIASAGIAEAAIVRRLKELQPSSSPKREEQSRAVEEAERIVRPPNIVPPREREGVTAQSAIIGQVEAELVAPSVEANAANIVPVREREEGISTQRIVIAIAIGVGAGVIGGAVLRGGRGGGFHRPATLTRGLLARAY